MNIKCETMTRRESNTKQYSSLIFLYKIEYRILKNYNKTVTYVEKHNMESNKVICYIY